MGVDNKKEKTFNIEIISLNLFIRYGGWKKISLFITIFLLLQKKYREITDGMKETLHEILSLIDSGAEVSTDTRTINNNSIFFALKGPNFDGNEYIEQAIEKGAILSVSDNENLKGKSRVVVVNEVLPFLQDCAREYRKKLDIPVIAITGSNGKTTTKELTASVLSEIFNTFYTKGNLNNHIGVPISILSIKKEHQIAVIEMGANHLKEIELLSDITQPSHGLITNIGKAHLEGFGSEENILKGKNELFQFLSKNDGFIFLNANDPQLRNSIKEYPHLITYGNQHNAQCSGKVISSDPFLVFSFSCIKADFEGEYLINTQLIGKYNLENALAAATIGIYMGVPEEKIVSAIENYTPGNNRSQLIKTKNNRIVMDAYNANPSSMNYALENFNTMKAQNKVAILGDMLELGKDQIQEHKKIADQTKEMNLDLLILIGPVFKQISKEIKGAYSFDNVEKAKVWIEKNPQKDKTILMKGSRGIRIDKLKELF